MKNTAPGAIREMVLDYLLGSGDFSDHLDVCGGEGNPIPNEWLEAAAMEAYVALTETLDTFVETLIAGRPYDTPLVEWEARDLSDVAEMLTEVGEARRAMGEEMIPAEDAPEAAASQERWR